MKKLLILLLIGCAANSYGQTDKPITKGNMLLGGSAGFSYTKISGEYNFTDMNGYPYPQTIEEKTTTFSLYPSIGYFVSDGLAIGFGSTFSYSHEKYGDQTYNGYAIGFTPFIKAYFNNGLFVSLQSGLRYNGTKSGDSKSTATQFTISPALGYAFFINPKVSIEPSIGYLYAKNIQKYQSISNETSKINELFFSIGFQIFL